MKMKTKSWADGKKADCLEVTAADPTPDVRESNTQRDSKCETGISDDDSKTFETIKGYSTKKIEARSNITLEKGRNEKEKTEWEGTYRNGVIASLMIVLLHCQYMRIQENDDAVEARIGGCFADQRYPATILEAKSIFDRSLADERYPAMILEAKSMSIGTSSTKKYKKKRNIRIVKIWKRRRNRDTTNKYDRSESN